MYNIYFKNNSNENLNEFYKDFLFYLLYKNSTIENIVLSFILIWNIFLHL